MKPIICSTVVFVHWTFKRWAFVSESFLLSQNVMGGGDGDGRRVGLEGLGMVGHVAPPPGLALTCSTTACRSSWTYWCYPSCQWARTWTGHQFIWRLKSRDTQPTTQWKNFFVDLKSIHTKRLQPEKQDTVWNLVHSLQLHPTPSELFLKYWQMSQRTSNLHEIRKADGERYTVHTGKNLFMAQLTRKCHWNSGAILPSAGNSPPLQGKPEQLEKTKNKTHFEFAQWNFSEQN